MICEHPKSDVVNAYQAARRRLKLGRYERYLVGHIAARVERLLGKRDEEDRAGDDPGDAPEAGGRAARMTPLARAHANTPPRLSRR